MSNLKAVVGALMLSAAVALGGCGWFDDSPRTVLVVGDSVTELSEEELQVAFGDIDLDVRAVSGATTGELVEAAREGVAEDPDVGVFMPGYNDVLGDQVDTPALDEMMAIAAELDCAIWFLIPTDGGFVRASPARWNDRVRALADEHDNVIVADPWKRLVEESEDFAFLSEADAIHPNAEGQKAIASVMAASAEEGCG